MSRHRSTTLASITGLVLALANAGALADVTTFFASQAPKADLNHPAPPPLEASVMTEMAMFSAMVAQQGRQEFEAGVLNFAYTGGTAMVSGNATGPIGGPSYTSLGLGRYNTTPGIGTPQRPMMGHWLEASNDFSIDFSAAISALSFFGTDFFDFDGTIAYSIFDGASLISTGAIETNNSDALNGNLIFFGVTSDVAFNRISFDITQTPGSTNPDVLGFDSLVVGELIVTPPGGVPEPGSLALVGLALLAMAGSRRARKD